MQVTVEGQLNEMFSKKKEYGSVGARKDSFAHKQDNHREVVRSINQICQKLINNVFYYKDYNFDKKELFYDELLQRENYNFE